MTFESFHKMRADGIRPCEVMAEDELLEFAEKATIFRRRRPGEAHLQLLRSAGDAIQVEFATDPDIRAWFLNQLPADLLAIAEMEQDAEDRPFPIEAADGEYRCSSCGQDLSGPHTQVIDRSGSLDRPISYCQTCVRATLPR